MASCRTLALVLPFLLAAPAHGFLGNGLALRSSATQMFSSQSAAAGLVRRSAEHLARRPARTAPLQMMAEEDPVFASLRTKLKRSSLFLIGMDGCGKEALALGLAKKLGYNFLDTNSILGQLLKKRVSADTFNEIGEEQFTALERAVLDEVQAYMDTVVSTGSLAPMQPENWAKFRTGLVAYIKVAEGELDPNGLQAPLASEAAALLDVDDKTRLGLLLAQRSGKYEEADVVFDCAAFPTEEERVKALAEAFAELISANPPAAPKLSEAHAQALSRIMDTDPSEDVEDKLPATSEQVPREQIQSLEKMLEKDSPDERKSGEV